VVGWGSSFREQLLWLLAHSYVSDVALFWAVAGTLHAVRHVRVRHALREDALRLKAFVHADH
jgi:hypothetical protein